MRFTVKYEGIDGTSRAQFRTLRGSAKYVEERFLGPEYIRTNGLQLEHGYLTFRNFNWSDIADITYGAGFTHCEFKDFAKTATASQAAPVLTAVASAPVFFPSYDSTIDFEVPF